MGRKYESIVETVGNTPVVRINHLAPQGVNVFVKVEAFNPLGSVKDRLALGVIEAAERSGELKPGQTKKELEGVFVVKDAKAEFVPIKTGIAGEKYFEIVTGLKDGDQVITGPFASVRSLKDNDAVKISTTPLTPAK